MAREKKKAPVPAHGIAALNRRAKLERAQQYDDSVWRNLNPLKAAPKMKHKSYFEAVENADKKKKKLEFEITTNREPPPGFEFIPTGHPELSQECKEQSRDRDAMFFIVSISKDPLKLDHHMNRLGYHFRSTIVDEARKALKEKGHHEQAAYVHEPGKPEPIPNSQREIDLEADAVLRDLFPRIPNTDRQEIINHAFKKDGKFNGEIKVGMAKELTLARRVQLAALAHIRHTHTRYDELLKESDWANARKAVEKPCLDIIVKWRGDEETGRDQLDEILREVIEISDTETESEDEGSGADNARVPIAQTRSVAASIPNRAVSRLARVRNHPIGTDSRTSSPAHGGPLTPTRLRDLSKAERRTARKTQKRFKRYAAAAEALASSSDQNGQGSMPGIVATPIEVVRRQGSAHPVNTYRTTPSAVAHETHMPRDAYGFTEIQRVKLRHSDGFSHDSMAGRPYEPADARADDGTEQFIRVPDAQRPKVGPYSANHSHLRPAPPLSPVRLGLQDMLLPSIEPRSPDGAQVLPDASQRVLRDGQRSIREVPRVISRPIVEPAIPVHHPRSPGFMAANDDAAGKRRRVTTYFPEDFQSSPTSYVRVPPRGQDGALRGPQVKYVSDAHSGPPRAPERVIYQEASWTRPGQEVRVVRPEDDSSILRAHPIPVLGDVRSPMVSMAADRVAYPSNPRTPIQHEYSIDRAEAPLRSRANPIVIDGGNHEPRRVIEVRGSPAHEIYRTSSPRGKVIRSPLVQGEPRSRDFSRVVYIDESAEHFRGEPGNHHHLAHQSQSGKPTYYEPSRPRSPAMPLHPQPHTQSRLLDQPTRYPIPYDGDVRIDRIERVPVAESGRAPREIQVSHTEAPGYERFPELHDHRPYLPDAGIAQAAMPPRPGDNVIYREIRPDNTIPPGAEYERAPQRPFPVHPAASSYVEIRGPPAHQRIPDHRDIIYVE